MATDERKSLPDPPKQLPDPHAGDPCVIRLSRQGVELANVLADDPREAAIDLALMILGRRELRIGDCVTVTRV